MGPTHTPISVFLFYIQTPALLVIGPHHPNGHIITSIKLQQKLLFLNHLLQPTGKHLRFMPRQPLTLAHSQTVQTTPSFSLPLFFLSSHNSITHKLWIRHYCSYILDLMRCHIWIWLSFEPHTKNIIDHENTIEGFITGFNKCSHIETSFRLLACCHLHTGNNYTTNK